MGPPGACHRPPEAGRPVTVCIFHRRHLRGSEKRGQSRKKTKSRRRTKIIAITDRAGPSRPVHVEPAPPPEITVLELTLSSGLVYNEAIPVPL